MNSEQTWVWPLLTDAVKNSFSLGPRGEQAQWYGPTLTKLIKYDVKTTCHLLMHIEIYIHQGDQVLLTLVPQILSPKENDQASSFIIRSAPGECGVRARIDNGITCHWQLVEQARGICPGSGDMCTDQNWEWASPLMGCASMGATSASFYGAFISNVHLPVTWLPRKANDSSRSHHCLSVH